MAWIFLSRGDSRLMPRSRLRLLPLVAVFCIGSSVLAEDAYGGRWECKVNDPLSCDQKKSEVCTFKDGGYSCECPTGVSRLPDGRCILIDECGEQRLNDCHENAKCIDQTEGYLCECLPGFADVSEDPVKKPGRICQPKVDECAEPQKYDVDCPENASCQDTADGFTCICKPGFTDISAQYSLLPGRKCVEIVNECTNGDNDCSSNADCIDQPDGYICKCRPGFVDTSPNVTHYPGRQCRTPKTLDYYGLSEENITPSECHPIHQPVCSLNEVCRRYLEGQHRCRCEHPAVIAHDGKCRVFNRCEQHHDCDRSAICSNTFDSYKCQCKPGYLDVSPDPVRLPGRKCQPLINECADRTDDCSPYATCEDTQDSYLCKCNHGYTDVSSRYGLNPGRKCAKVEDQCSDRTLNSCDENADCVMLPDGYTCKCFSGYIDVSSNANLPLGRVCTLQTTCPAQPTDLVFLIDGSGSIGSDIFRGEVLRFLKEFVELFDISSDRTRVAVVQYSDRIRHEFDLNQYSSIQSVEDAIDRIQYMTGLTRTGAAIEHVRNEAFNERRGARPLSDKISRVAIVITDGRSQDNVSLPAQQARQQNIQLFAVGVTNHVLDSELETIAGAKDRYFHVTGFKDLNARLRSAIQKVACPEGKPTPPTEGPCDPSTHRGCDRSLNQVCLARNGQFTCGCPPGFQKHPLTQVCGGEICNPQLVSSCPHPDVCKRTPFGNYRCACLDNYWRDPKTGACKTTHPPSAEPALEECDETRPCGKNEQCVPSRSGGHTCLCASDKCQLPGTCDPSIPESCDQRKREQCLQNENSGYTCQCGANYKRHPVTEICLIDECAAGTHDCDRNARCIDTDESFICTCHEGFNDESPDPSEKPGRVCTQRVDECNAGTHNCSINAVCVNLPDGFICRCKENYVDFSPNPLRFAGTDCRPLVDECADKTLNTCSENATCIDTRESYKCQCKEGFLDQDELRNPGRVCQKVNRICSEGRHDCDQNARCIERGANAYECVCSAGFLDKSPDPNRSGRLCVEEVCSDSSKHDCHVAAICTEIVGPERYKCACRDGYVDMNPSRPGRECKEALNECMDHSLNDCDPIATCQDQQRGYTCTCPIGAKDISPDRSKPGRKCLMLIDECRNPHLNNCSRFADCFDREDGYECKCKPEYHDNNPSFPGTDCSFIINECESDNLNDCSKHAKCTDTQEGYACECIAPYKDELSSNPGRVCRYNECEDPKMNDCDKNAECLDTDDDFTCRCNAGFYDDGNDPHKPGRVCIELVVNKPPEVEKTTLSPNLAPCASTFCHLDLGEVCIGGTRCGCRPNQNRGNSSDNCIDVEKIPIEIRIVDRGGEKLVYSSDYGSPNSPNYVDIVDAFNKGLSDLIKESKFAPQYVNTDVKYITNPKVKNSTWDSGLLFVASADFKSSVDKCEFWNELLAAIKTNDYRLGNRHLMTAKDIDQLDPCRKEEQRGNPCGSTFCRADLGEECIAGRLCGCPNGQKRNGSDEKCRQVESWNLPLWVIREGNRILSYTDELSNPQDEEHKKLVEAFEKGIAESYIRTPLKSGFVVAEVNDIANPNTMNKSWDGGILYNFTANFVRGTVSTPSQVFTDLIDYIIKKNNYEVGSSKQFISPDQADPFDACYKNDCHPKAICKSHGEDYTCECPSTFRDLNPSNPGHDCLSLIGVNECEKEEWNECDVNARCIDEDRLYRCECIKPYVNAAPKDKLPGSVCRLDYCSDVNFCPSNTTCKNAEDQAVCTCLPGYVDIRRSERRLEAGFPKESYCLKPQDVDECALGLHNCSAAAICTDLHIGYKCTCAEGYTDGNPSLPGRVCAALLCGLCNGHGDCVHDPLTNNITCACVEGYSGQFCELAPSRASAILLIILALLFLLLTLCCCLYFCLKTRCFGGRGLSASSLSGREEILGSDYYTIPRAKLKRHAVEEGARGGADDMDAMTLARRGQPEADAGALQRYLDGGASLSSGSSIEEIERRIITDVTRSEVRTTTFHDAYGEGTSGATAYGISSAATGGVPAQEHSAQFFVRTPVETDAEQYATSTADHFMHRSGGYSGDYHSQPQQMGGQYGDEDDIGGSDVGDAVYDRTTRVTTHRDFVPATRGRGPSERLRNEFQTTTTSNETNYF
uniref:Transmembrane cell adhesion receptor mua-3 n=1 Tax=Parascaris univalens TaxID=6257 RepID=A0A915AKQ6_PARUN